MKTVRFTQVVQRSGRPRVHSLWVAPEHDTELLKARKDDRVMTVESTGHGKADVGMVGFDAARKPGSQILIFPKSLKRFDGTRVVGIKFDEVEQVPLTAAGAHAGWKPPPLRHRTAGQAQRPPRAAELGTSRSTSETPAAEPDVPVGLVWARATNGKRDRDIALHLAGAAPGRNDSTLRREVRAALKELRAGKAVAAYQRLERAVGA